MQEVISDSNWFSLTSTSQQKQDATSYYQLKRILDVTIVLFSLILLLPLLFAIGILI
jgi:lipopolysaccharide/colanic/teichoic acid biosynthesis glycosyltransferase